MSVLQIKRAYEPLSTSDGYRILIDRLWPRGISRQELRLDDWARTIAPSTESRKAFAHDPAKFETFRTRYCDELSQNPAAPDFVARVSAHLREGNVTLLYGSRSETVNHAVILRDWVQAQLPVSRKEAETTEKAGAKS